MEQTATLSVDKQEHERVILALVRKDAAKIFENGEKFALLPRYQQNWPDFWYIAKSTGKIHTDRKGVDRREYELIHSVNETLALYIAKSFNEGFSSIDTLKQMVMDFFDGTLPATSQRFLRNIPDWVLFQEELLHIPETGKEAEEFLKNKKRQICHFIHIWKRCWITSLNKDTNL